MEKIIAYFNQQLSNCMVEKKQLESELERKKISSMEISRTMNKLIDMENDTDAIFRANISGAEFRNNEVSLLNSQIKNIKNEIDCIESKIQKVEETIFQLNELFVRARNFSFEYEEMKNSLAVEEMEPITAETEPAEECSDNLIENLRNISSRIDTALKFEKMDRERAKMELNLARVKLLFCIDDLEKK